MRILFSSVPAAGHLLPLVPLADAAADAGHETAFLSGADMAGYLGTRTLLPAGPDIPALLAETERRTGGGDARHPGAAAVEIFAGARVDLTFDQALDKARGYAPDLMVCEAFDFVGPLIAAALDLPWASRTVSASLPAPLSDAMQERANAQHVLRDLSPRQRFALIDSLPDVLRSAEDPPLPDDRVAVRPEAHRGQATGAAAPKLPTGRPRVLVTAGTSVRDPDLVASLAASVAAAGYEVAVTIEPGTLPQHPQVHELGFVPLAHLLPEFDVVVGSAGFGTVVATLAAGLPAVLRPVLADQPWNAQRVAAAGAGVTIEDPAEAGPAVRAVLVDPAYRAAAQAAAAAIASMPSPAAILDELLIRAGLSTRT